ncbi:flavodoxin domain-containing protein [Halalkalibacillus halophilus]|uniref:flavodoxin domain-containing protein n=1 Tax=Halalkalibacillus halophilus TaxID=392827 RepID=UPI00041F1799|nr:flavodoxin domain-containing protein [Halalkalibacillus halophilus]
MRAAVIYTSATGNTEELASWVYEAWLKRNSKIEWYDVEDVPIDELGEFDCLAIGTFTWGNGEIPDSMMDLYEALEEQDVSNVSVGIFGTGDRCYPHFCGAVDAFRDMLYVHANLAVTLKVELSPMQSEREKCEAFVDRLVREVVYV